MEILVHLKQTIFFAKICAMHTQQIFSGVILLIQIYFNSREKDILMSKNLISSFFLYIL